MKTLVASMLFQAKEQALPFFLEHASALYPRPTKLALLDFCPEQKFLQKKLPLFAEDRPQSLEKDFPKQLATLRNNLLSEARKNGFDSLLFLQPDIFPPSDILFRLSAAQKQIISPAFFTSEQGTVFSNGVKITGQNIEPLLFNDTLPSGVKKVDSVSLQALFLSGKALEKISFEPVNDSVAEMLSLASKAKELGLEIFLDSSTVCARLSQLQLVSHYYFKAQNALEPNPA